MSSSQSAHGGSLDVIVARKAYWQHGLVTTDQLQDLGASRAFMRTRIDRGQWVRAAPGVVQVAGSTVTWESRLLAQVLSAGDGAMASHRCAAALWKLDGFRRTSRPELVIPRTRSVERPGAILHRSSDLNLVRPVSKEGIPTTPVERTLLDLGTTCGRTEVLLAVDAARRNSQTDWDRLLNVLVRHARRGRTGVATLRSILDEHFGEVTRTDSAFERLVLVLLVENGLPKPTLQHGVQIAGHTYRIDLAYPDERIAIELDGQIHRDRQVWENDHVRRTRLANAGWHVVSFTWHTYQHDSVHILREVRSALRSRSG